MQISTDNMIKSIEQWVQNDLASKGSPLQKGFTTFVFLQGKSKLEQMLSGLKALGDEQGMFELDDLHTNLKASLQAMGGVYSIPLIGYNFDQQDLNKIFEYARGLIS